MASAENGSENNVLELYESKLRFLRKILTLTQAMTFHVPNEAQKYVTLIEKRGTLFEQISLLDKMIISAEAEAYAQIPESEAEAISKTKTEIRELAADILDLDMKMSEQVVRINSELRRHIKDYRQSKAILNVYRPDMIYKGGYIDSKK